MTAELIKPKRLRKGDRVGIIAPSARVREDQLFQLEACTKALTKRFKIEFEMSPNFLAVDRFGLSAGTAELRAADIHSFFARDDIHAIWCFQGGDTANQLLELLDYNLIKRRPKIFIGLSDITVLLNAIHTQTGMETFHGTDPKAGIEDWHMESEYSQTEFADVLFEERHGEIPPLRERLSVRAGKANGHLAGGNLRCFLKLAGTQYFPDLSGKILLLEGFTLDSKPQEVFCNIAKLKLQRNFDKLAGVLIGQYYGFDKEQSFDMAGEKLQFEQLFLEQTKEFAFPILKTFDFGHRCPSTFLPIGSKCSIDTTAATISLDEPYLS